MAARLKEFYRDEVVPQLKQRFGYSNQFEVPGLVKIVVNMGVGEAKDRPELLDSAVESLTAISGQRPVITRARRSISAFRIREGMPIGCKVTLRDEKMWDFLDRLMHIALPRVRDFRGLSADSFDGRGNYSLGLDEQLVFPEISYDDVEQVQGMDITVVTEADTDEEARELLALLGMPFRGYSGSQQMEEERV